MALVHDALGDKLPSKEQLMVDFDESSPINQEPPRKRAKCKSPVTAGPNQLSCFKCEKSFDRTRLIEHYAKDHFREEVLANENCTQGTLYIYI